MVQSYNTNVFNPNFFGIQSRTSIFSEAAKRASCPFYTGLSAHFSYAEKSEIGIYSLTAVQLSKVHRKALSSRPLKSPFLRDIVQVQYLAYFLKHAQKSFHSSFEVICCCREKYVHSISYHTLIKVAAQTIIRL